MSGIYDPNPNASKNAKKTPPGPGLKRSFCALKTRFWFGLFLGVCFFRRGSTSLTKSVKGFDVRTETPLFHWESAYCCQNVSRARTNYFLVGWVGLFKNFALAKLFDFKQFGTIWVFFLPRQTDTPIPSLWPYIYRSVGLGQAWVSVWTLDRNLPTQGTYGSQTKKPCPYMTCVCFVELGRDSTGAGAWSRSPGPAPALCRGRWIIFFFIPLKMKFFAASRSLKHQNTSFKIWTQGKKAPNWV